MRIKVKKLRDDVLLPTVAYKNSAGYDIYCNFPKGMSDSITVKPGETKIIPSGIAIEVPDPTFIEIGGQRQRVVFFVSIKPRSGLAAKHSITIANSPGTIDFGYTGEIGIIIHNSGQKDFVIKNHTRVAQMMLEMSIPFEWVESDELSDYERGEKGYGSSGL